MIENENETEPKKSLFDIFNINSPQNNRILIVGPSGSGKTTLLYDMVFNHLPKYRRHIYLHGAHDALKSSIIPELKKNGIKVYEKFIKNNNDTFIDLDKMQKHDLLIIDDLSDQMKSSSKLNEFLNKVFTTSRHIGFDVILIVHKFKLSNPMIRNNATKIILAGLDKELLDLFGDEIVNKEIKPIVLNPQDDFKQQKLVSDGLKPLAKKPQTASDMLKSINIKSDFIMPKFIRKDRPLNFIEVETNDEKYEYKIPQGLEKLFKRMIVKNENLILSHNLDPFVIGMENTNDNDVNTIKKAAIIERQKIDVGESLAGNDNTNINNRKKYVMKKRAK